MFQSKQDTDIEELKPELLKEWLFKIDGESRAYIMGASKALLYAQEIPNAVIEQANICVNNKLRKPSLLRHR